jgi:hypothetical protein
MGMGDLSFWCYDCDSYLHHLTMEKVYAMYATLHWLKFGEETVEVTEFTRPNMFTITEDEYTQPQPLPLSLSLSAGQGDQTVDRGSEGEESETKKKEGEDK